MHQILPRLYSRLSAYQQITAAWLFGSVAQGTDRTHSDIDIAVLFSEGISSEQRFDWRLAFMVELGEVAGRKVDIIDMEAAPLFLQHQVRKTGRLIIEKDHVRRVWFDVRSRREYWDMQLLIKRREDILLSKCGKEGGEDSG